MRVSIFSPIHFSAKKVYFPKWWTIPLLGISRVLEGKKGKIMVKLVIFNFAWTESQRWLITQAAMNMQKSQVNVKGWIQLLKYPLCLVCLRSSLLCSVTIRVHCHCLPARAGGNVGMVMSIRIKFLMLNIRTFSAFTFSAYILYMPPACSLLSIFAFVQYSPLLSPSSITGTYLSHPSQRLMFSTSSLLHKSTDKCILNSSCLSLFLVNLLPLLITIRFLLKTPETN